MAYKFVDSPQELNESLDELYADMKGYSGHDAWRNFYSVIYTTGQFASQEEVDAKFQSVGADESWSVFLLPGTGGRKEKAKK